MTWIWSFVTRPRWRQTCVRTLCKRIWIEAVLVAKLGKRVTRVAELSRSGHERVMKLVERFTSVTEPSKSGHERFTTLAERVTSVAELAKSRHERVTTLVERLCPGQENPRSFVERPASLVDLVTSGQARPTRLETCICPDTAARREPRRPPRKPPGLRHDPAYGLHEAPSARLLGRLVLFHAPDGLREAT